MAALTFRAVHGSLWALLLVSAALFLSAEAYTEARKLIACSPYVYPCHCGLCPHIVNCETKKSAECFCGTAAPGTYPHPEDNTKFWMCSHDRVQQVKYGVEVACPGRLLFDPVLRVCTLPDIVAQSKLAAPAAGRVAKASITVKLQKRPLVSYRAVPVERARVAVKP